MLLLAVFSCLLYLCSECQVYGVVNDYLEVNEIKKIKIYRVYREGSVPVILLNTFYLKEKIDPVLCGMVLLRIHFPFHRPVCCDLRKNNGS